jgi:hypothetical protein
MMTLISLKIDIIQGTIEVECEAADFESVISSAERVLSNFSGNRSAASVQRPVDNPRPEYPIVDRPELNEDAGHLKSKTKSRRKKGGGHANWKVLDNLLTETQRGELRKFYAEKAPGKQNDQVAVLAHKLSEMLGRDGFDGNEIHTAFQTVNEKTPANLTGVFGNMTGEGLGKVVDKKWTPNFKSSDLVKHDLPAATPVKK